VLFNVVNLFQGQHDSILISSGKLSEIVKIVTLPKTEVAFILELREEGHFAFSPRTFRQPGASAGTRAQIDYF